MSNKMMGGTFLMPANLLRLCGMLILATLMSCAGKSAPSGNVEQKAEGSQPGGGINQLNSIAVEERADHMIVVLEGSAPMSPNIFKLTDPDRIIVDLTETKLGSVQSPVEVGKGSIGQITVNQFDDTKSSLSRVVIGLTQPVEYQVESQGSKLSLTVGKSASAVSTQDQAGLPIPPDVSPMSGGGDATLSPEPTPEVPPLTVETVPPPEASPPIAPGVSESAFPAVVSATKLVDVQYSSGSNGTVVRLIGDGNIDRYEDLILKGPTRVVVDLQGIKNAYPGAKSIDLGTSEVSKLRIGGGKGKVRIVLDSTTEVSPAYTVTREGNALVVNVTSSTVAETSPEPAVAEPAVAEPAVAEPAPVETSAPKQVAPSLPPAWSGPVVITGLGFKQMKDLNKSRLIISLNNATSDYQTRDEGPTKFVLSVGNSKLEKQMLKREFNTREFQTAILSVTPKTDKRTKATEFAIELEQQVPYAVTQEGNNIFVDVDVPERLLRRRSSDLVKTTPSAAPLPPETSTATESSSVVGGSKEIVLDSSAVNPTQESDQPVRQDRRPKDYRYVKESFMSESMSSDEPLTQMGAILSGELDGKRFTGRKISLDFKDADVRSIFRLIADISKFNMIISDDVEGRVTIRLDDVPWDQAFAIILQTRGLWFEKYGNIVRIAPAEKLRKERELSAAAARAAKAAKPLDVLFKPVSFAQASTLTKQVGSVLSERGTVDIDSRTNTLIIKDIRENLDKARRMVDILDTQTPQVSIESRIVEATTTFTRSFGIQWGGNARFTAATGNPTGVFFPNSVGVSPFALNFPVEGGFINSTANISLGSINNIVDLDLQLALGEQEGHAKLISAPKVTVLDNRSATITAGSKIPFLTQTANAGSNVRFESAATTLTVTPHITNDGSILMNISATRSEPNFAQTVSGNPLIDQRNANTEVLVKSGNTTVLGGIYSTASGRSQNRFPYLGSIPIIGSLFRNYNKTLRRTELLIFVTPRIVGDEREVVREVRE